MSKYNDLLDKLIEYTNKDYLPMHMPGAKRNDSIYDEEAKALSRLDITEIEGFDNMHDASGVILPQTIPANTRFIEIELLTKEKVYGIMPTTYTFEPGKSYVFNIDVVVDRDASEFTLNDIQIVDWVNEYSSPQDIEAERTN